MIKDTDSFIKKANLIHENKYNYDKSIYVNLKTKITITCKIHGDFEQTPYNHIYKKCNCKKCSILIRSKKITKSKEKFTKESNNIHNYKYDYSKADYINYNSYVTIICKEHGEFKQKPKEHMKGSGCPKCGYIKASESKTKKQDDFIYECNNLYKNKYNYSLVIYKSDKNKIKIICNIHGIFEQRPNNHLSGQGCPKCNGGIKSNTNDFIKKALEKQGNIYQYDLVEYINNRTKIKIICKKHGIFEQRPDKHLLGQGCPKCKFSKGEKEILKILNKYNIKYDYQKQFDNCFFKKLKFDFYLPDLNICIEYDGIQHFNPNKNFGKEKGFLETKTRDKIKNEYCKNNNINLLRISYKEFKDIEKIILSIFKN